jgi:6-phosphofructokinase
LGHLVDGLEGGVGVVDARHEGELTLVGGAHEGAQVGQAVQGLAKRGELEGSCAVALFHPPVEGENDGDADGGGDNRALAGSERATACLARRLPKLMGLETRLTSLGHVVRGGTPSATDRILATQRGNKAVGLLAEGVSGVMVAVCGRRLHRVPLQEVADQRNAVPLDHPLLQSLRMLNISLGT